MTKIETSVMSLVIRDSWTLILEEFEGHIRDRVSKGRRDDVLRASTVIGSTVSNLITRDTHMGRDPAKENRAHS